MSGRRRVRKRADYQRPHRAGTPAVEKSPRPAVARPPAARPGSWLPLVGAMVIIGTLLTAVILLSVLS